MSLYPPPQITPAAVWTSLPEEFRVKNAPSDWVKANAPGQDIHSFLEGPSFDRLGNLWVTDIPYGRLFKISPDKNWSLVAQYDGWPNGLKFHQNGKAYIADYKRGILQLDPVTGAIKPVVTHRNSEHFRGCNDLFFDRQGRLYFTDQGQSGMDMPNGRVYRYDLETERLDLLLDVGQSPNGLVMNAREDMLYVAMTRGNSVWRLPFMASGEVAKVGVFIQLSGGLAGPDGLALDDAGGLWIAHAGNASVWGFDPLGRPVTHITSATGLKTTNLAFGGPDNKTLFITESDTGNILFAKTDIPGKPMFPDH